MEEQFYEEYARVQGEHWWFVGRRRIIGSLLERRLGDGRSGNRRILDVGCGTGANLAELGRFGKVEGVDSEPEAVRLCRRAGWEVQHVAGESLPFEDGSFDLVTLLDVIEHVDDDENLLREAGRLLTPGGLVLVTVPAYTWMWGAQDEISHHYRRYTRGRLLDSFGRADIEVSGSTYFNTLLFPPIAAIRLLRQLSPEPEEHRSDFELNQPGAMNRLLARVFSFEALLLPRVRMPFGVSVLGFGSPRSRTRTSVGRGGK